MIAKENERILRRDIEQEYRQVCELKKLRPETLEFDTLLDAVSELVELTTTTATLKVEVKMIKAAFPMHAELI